MSEPFTCYSITKNVKDRRKVIASDIAACILMESWDYLRKANQIKLLAFCIMPDHFHLLFCLLQEKSLSEVIGSTSKFTAREINKCLGSQGQFWQDGFHDHRSRNEIETDDLAIYIEHNPVRAGFVEIASEWPYSSTFPLNAWLLDRDWYAQAR
jgi:REP element-mobilizing transposase RayT